MAEASDTLPPSLALAPDQVAVTATADPAGDVVRVAWEIDPSALPAPPEDCEREGLTYRTSVGFDTFWLPFGSKKDQRLHLSRSQLGHSIPVELGLRVVAESESSAIWYHFETTFTLPACHHLERSDDWTLGPPEIVVDDVTRREAGLSMWVDGSIGFAELTTDEGTAVYGFAPNGPAGSRWRVGAQAFVDEVLDDAVQLEVKRGDEAAPHASGGPVYHDRSSGLLLMLYHGEHWADDDPLAFWSFIGLARSTDQGVRWADLGPIIEPNLSSISEPQALLTEVGGAPYVLREVDGLVHMYVYFRDTLADATTLNLSVARAPLQLVLDAAQAGHAARFRKWSGEGWDGAGLGGPSAELLPRSPLPRWFDVVEMVDHGMYVMVATDGIALDWTYVLTTSEDGVVWSDPVNIADPVSGGERLYVSLSSPSPLSQRAVKGDTIHLYQTRSSRGFPRRWDEAVIERAVLTYRGG